VKRPRWPSNASLFRFHGWLGINLGLLLFIVCFSGALATFSQEIEWLLNPAMRAAPPQPGAAYAPWTAWYAAAQEAHPAGRVLSLDRPDGPRWAARATVAYSDLDWRYVYIDPYTGRVNASLSEFGIGRFFRSFHKQFYIYPGDLPHGVYAVGPLGLVLLLSLFSGLLFYRFRWRDLLMRGPWRTRRAFWSGLHRATGMWTVPMAILITATGVWYFVERAVGDASIELPLDTPTWTAPEQAPGDALWPISLDDAIRLATIAVPSFDVTSVSISRGDRPMLTLEGQADAWLVRDAANRVRISAHDGRVEEVTLAQGLHPVARWGHTADPLHFGTFGGTLTKAIWFAAGLFSSLAILLGIRVWYMRSVPDPGLGTRPAGVLAGIGLTIVVLAVSIYGCVVNIGDALVSAPAPRFVSLDAVRLGTADVGLSAAADGSALHLRVEVAAGTGASIRRAWAWLGEDVAPSAVPSEATPLVARWEGLSGTIALEPGAPRDRVWLAAEDAAGRRFIDGVPVGTVPVDTGTIVAVEIVPVAVWMVIALFAATCVAVGAAWYRWIQRSTASAALRVTAQGAATRRPGDLVQSAAKQ
jgi:uncharacterized iron-regulated membrane protein